MNSASKHKREGACVVVGSDHEYVVTGKQAKQILEELNSPPKQEKIDRLRKALANRVGKKQSGDK